jgi:hypothetical protein
MAGQTIMFRMPAATLLVLPIGIAAVGLELLELAARQHSALAGSVGLPLAFYAVTMLVTGVLLRVELSPAGVRIRTARRSRLVGWAEIRAITIEPQRRGGPRVTLWTVSGGRVRLPLPMANKKWNEAAFVREYHQIGQYWLATRGPDERSPAGHWPGQPLAGGWPEQPLAGHWPGQPLAGHWPER